MGEEILRENPGRLVLYPIRYPTLWDAYRQAQACFWTAAELQLDADRADFETKLTPPEQRLLTFTLGFFAASDGIVLENLVTQFCGEVQIPEARCFYAFQAAMENVHAETYALLIDTLIADRTERDALLNAVTTIPVVGAKAEWALRRIDPALPFRERLVAFAAVEGIMFSSAFASIFWIKGRGILPGTVMSNDLIARDEGMHTDFACLLYGLLERRLTDAEAHAIIRSAVDVEHQFVQQALPAPLEGMNPAHLCTYVEYVADRLLVSLGHPRMFHAKNPFHWMDEVSLQRHSNFFEQRPTEYHRPLQSTSVSTRPEFDDDF